MFNAQGGAGDRVLGTCTYYSNQVRGLLTYVVRRPDDVSDVLPCVDQTGKAQVTDLDVTVGERLRKQNVLWLKEQDHRKCYYRKTHLSLSLSLSVQKFHQISTYRYVKHLHLIHL